jgi:hypothetical protein
MNCGWTSPRHTYFEKGRIMGSEATCVVRHDGHSSEGRAELEGEAVLFRGACRLKIRFQEITRADVYQDSLRLVSSKGTVEFALGKATAEKWLQKILNPKTASDKLGIKPGMNIAVLGIDDVDFLKQLETKVGSFERKIGKQRDIIIWGVKNKKELVKLCTLEGAIERAGAVWAIWPKGKPELKEDDIRAAALAVGLVDVKVMKFSDSHSGLKLVIPKVRR